MKWPLVTRHTLEREKARTRRETRRSLVNHLRQNQRGLVCLDEVILQDITAPGPLTILGEPCIIRGNMFLTGLPGDA